MFLPLNINSIIINCHIYYFISDPRPAAALSNKGPCRLPNATGHGIFLPARGFHQCRSPKNWLRSTRLVIVCVHTHR